jgi:hypothetical protein
MPTGKNQKFFTLVKQVQDGEVDPANVDDRVEKTAQRMPKQDVQTFADDEEKNESVVEQRLRLIVRRMVQEALQQQRVKKRKL